MPDFPEARSFKYTRPELKRGKAVIKLCQTDRMIGIVQVVTRDGGETNLHSHPNLDGMWMILSGRVAFYGPEHKLIGEYGKYEGVLIPRGCPYWFEAVGDEDAEILQVEAFDIRIPDDKTLMQDRINYEKPKREIALGIST